MVNNGEQMAKNGVYRMILVYIICVNLFHINTSLYLSSDTSNPSPVHILLTPMVPGPKYIYIYVVNPN